MNNPFVSVIIPNYCHSKFLDERIMSVLNQTYQDFELIILDDCSPDNGASKAVIEKYRNNPKVSRIVYNEVNSGSTFKQWNKGFDLAKGELIWIAESDDSCEIHFLEKLVVELEKDKDCIIAFCASLRVNADGLPFKHNKLLNIKGHFNGREFIRQYLSLFNIIGNASSAVFRKSVLNKIDSQYTKYKGAGDQLFWIELCEKGNVAYVNEFLSKFRQHGVNSTSKYIVSGTNFQELKGIHDYLIKQHLISKNEEKRLIQRIANNIVKTTFDEKRKKTELLQLWKVTKSMLFFSYLNSYYITIKSLIKNTIGY